MIKSLICILILTSIPFSTVAAKDNIEPRKLENKYLERALLTELHDVIQNALRKEFSQDIVQFNCLKMLEIKPTAIEIHGTKLTDGSNAFRIKIQLRKLDIDKDYLVKITLTNDKPPSGYYVESIDKEVIQKNYKCKSLAE
ncbi:hypothetical protein NLX71_26085 [Paenibacillus sp. MZ04-78.2]|uniref:hypothetical protein n=1 Tax=Paenibacillus sp. MZ04-78.2 TaxID=2962034 RepID=UPI0020B784AF|nr:hypothetical protein [Paenibacillus sp. MZ04-78.2]MCP3776711.1 hypothetical protein [Paenibacillus sp. MZ04-78.2]